MKTHNSCRVNNKDCKTSRQIIFTLLVDDNLARMLLARHNLGALEIILIEAGARTDTEKTPPVIGAAQIAYVIFSESRTMLVFTSTHLLISLMNYIAEMADKTETICLMAQNLIPKTGRRRGNYADLFVPVNRGISELNKQSVFKFKYGVRRVVLAVF